MSILLKRYFALLATYLKPQWHRSLLLGFVLLGSTGLQLLSPHAWAMCLFRKRICTRYANV
jgi:hypothetical protein